MAASVWLEPGELDDLAPFVHFVRNKFSELGGRHGHGNIAKLHDPVPNGGICKPCLNLIADPFDDLAGRIPRRADT